LKDKTFILQPAVAGTDGASTNSTVRNAALFNFSVNFKRKPVTLKANSATPTVASLSDHNIFLLAHANIGVLTIEGAARTYYID